DELLFPWNKIPVSSRWGGWLLIIFLGDVLSKTSPISLLSIILGRVARARLAVKYPGFGHCGG
ncbi:MAG TPA: hypothetical protein VHY08_13915, partial [Bacillota bacterium]|nr:hypothetical protein [Bacillota bacterium]